MTVVTPVPPRLLSSQGHWQFVHCRIEWYKLCRKILQVHNLTTRLQRQQGIEKAYKQLFMSPNTFLFIML